MPIITMPGISKVLSLKNTLVCILLLFLAGDVELNPGPTRGQAGNEPDFSSILREINKKNIRFEYES